MKKSPLSKEIEKSRPLYLGRTLPTCSDITKSFESGGIDQYTYILKMYEKLKVIFEVQELLKRTDIESISIDSNDVKAMLKSGISLAVDKSCRSAVFEILNFGSYEQAELGMISSLLQGSNIFFDIGAHIGWYSLNLALAHKALKFFAFEPIPKTFSYLLKNVQSNKIKNIHAYNLGFADKEKKVEFFYSEVGSAIASEKNIFDTEFFEKVNCHLKKVDDFVDEEDVDSIDFMKCDVEGAELIVLRGAIVSIKNFLPIIFLEIVEDWCRKFGYGSTDIISFLSKLGYCMFEIHNGRLLRRSHIDPNLVKNFNYFFLHSEKHADKISSYSL